MRSKKGHVGGTKSLFFARMRFSKDRSVKKEEVYEVYRSAPEMSQGNR
jgi:hypothetical protein